MIKKLFFIIVLILTLYIVLIFISPALADKIESTLGFEGLNEKIRTLKSSMDDTYTNIPSKDQFLNTIDEVKNQAEIKTKDALDGVNEVKNTIDGVRSTLSGAASTYSEIKGSIDETKTQIENSVTAIKDTADTINNIGQSINNTLSGTLNNN
ncbi:MAG: hypothetical protein PHI37_04240 [Candidatus Gracilibacteria bacterium]|nr:hypothetical protein [Candidatus Gracilibacteria bacterium]